MRENQIPSVEKTETAMNTLGAGWNDRGIAARFAYATMLMSRKKMIEFHAETDHEQVDQLLASFLETAEFLKYIRSWNDRGRANAAHRNSMYRARSRGIG